MPANPPGRAGTEHPARPRARLLRLLVVLALVGSTMAVATPAQATRSLSSVAETAETRLLARVNAVRVANGLAPLRARGDLVARARRHSASMSASGTLFHTPDFRVICCWSSIAENVGFGSTAASVHRMLMRSTPHRANILDRGKRAVGIGVVRTGDRIWVTQVFRRPA